MDDDHTLIQFGNEYALTKNCVVEELLDIFIREAEEDNVYRLWYNFDLL